MGAQYSYGVDFGTTNTVIARANQNGDVDTVQFGMGEQMSDVYRSVLCFQKIERERSFDVEVSAGLEAIKSYLSALSEIRFIQSFKSHAASRLFEETRVFGQKYRFEDLLAAFLQTARKSAANGLDEMGTTFISGRPVAFVGASPDDQLAMERYELGYKQAGFPTPQHVYEPVGAAYSYAKRLKKDATVLVGDFGGGTSDFSIIRFERHGDRVVAHPLGYAGVGIAGDSFDYRIIDAVICPELGKGTEYKSFDKILEIPKHYFANFARWHQLAVLKTPQNMNELEELWNASLAPDKLEALIDTIMDDRGFDIYRAVSGAKAQLSSNPTANLQIKLGKIQIDQEIKVDDFEHWIEKDLNKIGQAVDGLFAREHIKIEDIDHVFLTGGSSFIPAVKRLFADRFGPEKLADGNQFQSVAHGLALIGLLDDVEPWLAGAELGLS